MEITYLQIGIVVAIASATLYGTIKGAKSLRVELVRNKELKNKLRNPLQ